MSALRRWFERPLTYGDAFGLAAMFVGLRVVDWHAYWGGLWWPL